MIQIRGIVKTANQVKRQLDLGVHPQKVGSLKEFVRHSLQTIEHLCKKAKTSPNSLPTRSRKAYLYLKNIDWQNLPLTKRLPDKSAATSSPTLRIKNVIKQQKDIQQLLGKLKPNAPQTQLKKIRQALSSCVGEIERICQQNKLTATALTTPSRKAYAWMKFLTDELNFQRHVKTIQKIQTLATRIIAQQQLEDLEFRVVLTNYNGLYKYKKNRQGNIDLHLSEGFIEAEDEILQAILRTILLESSPQDKQLIRHFGLSEEYGDTVLELDLIADLDAETPRGNYYDLEELFQTINREYFADLMLQPRLTWNQTLTNRKLGHYEPLRDRVVMSRTLDSSHVPQFVVELVLYHELLHKHHGIKWVNGKSMVHTPEFRRSEGQFKYYTEAQQWLEQSLVLAM